MSKNQTRMNSADRRAIVLSHNIKKVDHNPQRGTFDDQLMRALGRRACSQVEAVLARRASFKTKPMTKV